MEFDLIGGKKSMTSSHEVEKDYFFRNFVNIHDSNFYQTVQLPHICAWEDTGRSYSCSPVHFTHELTSWSWLASSSKGETRRKKKNTHNHPTIQQTWINSICEKWQQYNTCTVYVGFYFVRNTTHQDFVRQNLIYADGNFSIQQTFATEPKIEQPNQKYQIEFFSI